MKTETGKKVFLKKIVFETEEEISRFMSVLSYFDDVDEEDYIKKYANSIIYAQEFKKMFSKVLEIGEGEEK